MPIRRRLRVLGVLLASILPALVHAGPAHAQGMVVPRGYWVSARTAMTPNVIFVQYRSITPRRIVNVAFLKPGGTERLRTVLSGDRVAGTTETVRSMCFRVKCFMAVNGDFFSHASGQPSGGLAMEGVAVRTPPETRHHLVQTADGAVAVRRVAMKVSIEIAYAEGEPKIFDVQTLNTPRPNGGSTLYSPHWAPTTRTAGGYEIVIDTHGEPLTLDKPVKGDIVAALPGGDAAIPETGVVLSAAGGPVASTLWRIWEDVAAGRATTGVTITVDSDPDVTAFTGGTPVLLDGGKPGFTPNRSTFYATRAPRTMAGVLRGGTTALVQVDGRQPSRSVGMTMVEAMQFMRSLGAVDALNLDGGGSSTFIKNPYVVNRPSDGRERKVATAVAIVR